MEKRQEDKRSQRAGDKVKVGKLEIDKSTKRDTVKESRRDKSKT